MRTMNIKCTILSLTLLQLGILIKADENQIVAENIPTCRQDQHCVAVHLCENGYIIQEARLVTITYRSSASNNPAHKCPQPNVCCSFKKKLTRQSNYCGLSQKNDFQYRFEDKGYVRSEADLFEFPWTLALLINQSYHCGATLIHPKVAVTAAHCVRDEENPSDNFVLRAGQWNSSSNNESHQRQEQTVEEVKFYSFVNNAINDIALLFLSEKFDSNDHVKPICLPPIGYNFDYSNCVASGWGRNQFNGTQSAASVMKRIELQVVPSKMCQDELRKSDLGEYFELDKSCLCAGGRRNIDTCVGDGGSPLVCPIPNTDNRYYLAGLVSWGIGCGRENYPGVYANVAEFRRWIDNEIIRKDLDRNIYEFDLPK